MSTPAAGRTAFPFRLDDPDFTETGSARLLPAHGSIRLASHPARPESAADCRADGRRPGRGTASAAGRNQDRLRAEQRAAEVVELPLVPASGLPADSTSATDLAVELNGMAYQACRGDFVIRLDGSTCLQLWNREGRVVRREGDPLEVAQWLQACHDAGIKVSVQVNESVTP